MTDTLPLFLAWLADTLRPGAALNITANAHGNK